MKKILHIISIILFTIAFLLQLLTFLTLVESNVVHLAIVFYILAWFILNLGYWVDGEDK